MSNVDNKGEKAGPANLAVYKRNLAAIKKSLASLGLDLTIPAIAADTNCSQKKIRAVFDTSRDVPSYDTHSAVISHFRDLAEKTEMRLIKAKVEEADALYPKPNERGTSFVHYFCREDNSKKLLKPVIDRVLKRAGKDMDFLRQVMERHFANHAVEYLRSDAPSMGVFIIGAMHEAGLIKINDMKELKRKLENVTGRDR